jgi:hypothetical protein
MLQGPFTEADDVQQIFRWHLLEPSQLDGLLKERLQFALDGAPK